MIGYVAAGVGADEIRFGRQRLLERVDRAGFELLSANIYDKRGGEMRRQQARNMSRRGPSATG